MVSRHIVERQLHRIGFNPFTWGRSEVRELCNIMMDDEEVIECVNGEYSNGFALLAATNHRVLLVDKKPFLYLTVEDVRFEQISDFNFRNRFFTATVTICTSNKTMHFTSYNKKRLRQLINCVQKRVVDLRQHHPFQQQSQSPAAKTEPAPVPAAATPPTVAAASAEPSHPPAPQPPHMPGALVTYTRSRLSSFHLHHGQNAGTDPGQAAVPYQQGYAPGSMPDYRMPAQ